MNDVNNVIATLTTIGVILTAVAGAITGILAVFGKLTEVWNTIVKPFWSKVLKPCVKILIFMGTQVVPNGIIVWTVLYRAAENSNRLTEPSVFLSLIAQATIFISLYAIVWGMWLFPWLQPLLVMQKRKAQQLSSSSQPNAKNKQKSDIETPSEYQ